MAITFRRVSFDIPTPNGQTTGAFDFRGVGVDGVI